MKIQMRQLRLALGAAVLALALPMAHGQSTNPCAAKNPCAPKAGMKKAKKKAYNPCAAKNPCAANPCAAKNPCAANPCAAKKK